MRPSKFTEEQILNVIQQVKDVTPAVAVCRAIGITQTTFYRWRKKYDCVALNEGGEVRRLRDENDKLKQIVANLLLERQDGPDARGRR